MLRTEFVDLDPELERRLDEAARVDRALFDLGDPYAQLPEAIKSVYSRDEYLWLSDYDKITLVQRECEPDV